MKKNWANPEIEKLNISSTENVETYKEVGPNGHGPGNAFGFGHNNGHHKNPNPTFAPTTAPVMTESPFDGQSPLA